MDVTPEAVRAGMAAARYITTARVETVLFLALVLEKPLLIEGPAGAGKTEIGKVLAATLRHRADPPAVLRRTRRGQGALRVELPEAAAAHSGRSRQGLGWEEVTQHVFSREYLLERPLLRAITTPRRAVLLIDEIDKADEEFEAFLLELLSDFQVTIPELGTIRAQHRPVVVLTSNRARELSEALKRRCLLSLARLPRRREGARDHRPQGPRARAAACRRTSPSSSTRCASSICTRRRSIAETLDWARALVALGIRELDPANVRRTLAVLLKHEEDIRKAEPKIATLKRR